MGYSDDELALLEQLTYLDENVYREAGVDAPNFDNPEEIKSIDDLIGGFDEESLRKLDTVGTIIDPNDPRTKDDDESTYMQGYEWAAIIREIQSNKKLNNLAVYDLDMFSGDNSNLEGFKESNEYRKNPKIDRIVFCKESDLENPENGDAIVCYRGTLGAEEWFDNEKYYVTGHTPDNVAAYEKFKVLPFAQFYVTGHSKGANKAVYDCYMDDRVIRCVPIDPPGYTSLFYNDKDIQAGLKRAEDNHLIQIYAAEMDFVNILLCKLRGADYHYCIGTGQAEFFENHSPNTPFVCVRNPLTGEWHLVRDSNGSLFWETEQNETMKKLHDFTVFADSYIEPKSQFSEFLSGLVVIGLLKDGQSYEDYIKGDGNPNPVLEYMKDNPEMSALLIATFLLFANKTGFGWDDLKGICPRVDILLNAIGLLAPGLSVFTMFFQPDNLFEIIKAYFEDDNMYNSIRFSIVWSIICKLIQLADPNITPEQMDAFLELLKKTYREQKKHYNTWFPNTYITAPSSNSQTDFSSDAASAGCFMEPDNSEMYVDKNVYDDRVKDINNSSDDLTFDDSAFELEDSICGTDSMSVLTNNWKSASSTTTLFRELLLGPTAFIFNKNIEDIQETTSEIADHLETSDAASEGAG